MVAHDFLKHWQRHRRVVIAGSVRTKANKLLRVRHGQVAQHESVEQTENGGVGADAERESENGDGGESRRFAQHERPLQGSRCSFRDFQRAQSHPASPLNGIISD